MNKKILVTAAIAALMGVGGYFGHATATPAEGLSDLELANAEALADNTEIDLGYDKACVLGTKICAISAFQWYWDADPFNE